ncbi:MAG: hypothetical protein GY858_09835 [Candidatus Omnitrophica bacterium]|nr:hypothetical protein [Candidatus Omnitrophota bacterium]
MIRKGLAFGLLLGLVFCAWAKSEPVDVIVIVDQDCEFCSVSMPKEFLRDKFDNLNFKDIDYKEAQAVKIIKKYKVNYLPCFMFSSAIKKTKNYSKIEKFFQTKKRKIFLTKERSGIFRFLNRKKEDKKIDYFLDFFEDNSSDIFNGLEELAKAGNFKLNVYFLNFTNPGYGYPHQEINTALLVKKLYPDKLFSFLRHRLINIKDVSCSDSLESVGIDAAKIKESNDEATLSELNKENYSFIEEIGIKAGNVVLVENNRIFKIFTPDQEVLKKLFRR